jgi:hypothetical protein
VSSPDEEALEEDFVSLSTMNVEKEPSVFVLRGSHRSHVMNSPASELGVRRQLDMYIARRSMRNVLIGISIVLCGGCVARSLRGSRDTRIDATLRSELLQRVSNDQAARAPLAAALQRGAMPDSSMIALLGEVDANNQGWIAQILAQRGWPGRSTVGADGADAAFLLVQHADGDTALQVRALPLLARAFRAGEADGQQYALLTDRVASARGLPQVYGTQARIVDGHVVLKPIADSTNVDARRAEVGLPPLRSYLATLDSVYGKQHDRP